ncbi:response regulator transcription factor [uncultured Treponema sp.]|uniref:response regulator transcription factor n=1 Tax=uncultured Treponema sp. TaxID=162155 RepID=UPI0025EB09B1|nr:response regulator transcription factor [uncultured Treponema sp.]
MKKLIFIFESEQVAEEGIKSWISRNKDLQIAATANTVEDAIEIIDQAQLEEDERVIAILELNFRGIGEQKNEEGYKILKAIKESGKDIRALVFTSLDNCGHLRTSMSERYGAMGFISKECGINTLFEAIYSILEGNKYFSGNLKDKLTEVEEIYQQLSKTEKIVLKCALCDMNNHEIAEKLGISIRTVENHISHIYSKTKTYDRHTLFTKIGGGGYKYRIHASCTVDASLPLAA